MNSIYKFFNCTNFIVPTPLEGGGGGRNYKLKWVFLFSQFWPIDIFIVES